MLHMIGFFAFLGPAVRSLGSRNLTPRAMWKWQMPPVDMYLPRVPRCTPSQTNQVIIELPVALYEIITGAGIVLGS